MRRGFVLIATSIVLAVLLGLAALVVDAGRMYIIKSELQAFADAASLSAAMQFDGTSASLERSRAAVLALTQGDHPMKWDMGTRDITDIHVMFGDGLIFAEHPRQLASVQQVRVQAAVPAPIIFLKALGAFQNEVTNITAAGTAVAGAHTRLVE